MTKTTPPVSTSVVSTGDAELHVEVRGQGPALFLFGCPMNGAAFAPLANELAAGHTVITTDPRGINRSRVADSDADVTPEMLAGDLVQILDHLNIDDAAVFGSSGGAAAALALAILHPNRVHTVIAHEPPLEELLEDRAELRANTEDMVRQYLSGDVEGAWATFFAGADVQMPDGAISQWINGRSDPQELADEHFFFAHTLRPTTWWQPDIDALRDGPGRIVLGVGRESAGQVCDRTTTAALGSALDRVAVDGPYNEHLIRDIGGLNLALTVVIIAAAVTLTRPLVVTAAAATAVYGVPHLLYHAFNTDVLGAGDVAASLAGLMLFAALPVAIVLAERMSADSSSG